MPSSHRLTEICSVAGWAGLLLEGRAVHGARAHGVGALSPLLPFAGEEDPVGRQPFTP
jgi:hypothetical protein